MTNTDGERLATVTYLPGVNPASELTHDDSLAVGVPTATDGETAPRRLPTFQDFDRGGEEPVASTHPAGRDRQERPERTQKVFDQISNISMHALARRGMSSREMEQHLVDREFDTDTVAEEIDRLERVGLLDDVALGETLVRTLRERKGLGRSALNAELRRRRLDPDAIGAVLETLEDDELDRALAIAIKREPQLRVHDRATAKRRLVAFLMRKGYSGGTSAKAAEHAMTGGSEERNGPAFR